MRFFICIGAVLGLLIPGVPLAAQEDCGGCVDIYIPFRGWNHYFELENPPPLQFECDAAYDPSCGDCHETTKDYLCEEVHDVCPWEEELDLDGLVAAATSDIQAFRLFLLGHSQSLKYDHGMEAIRVEGCSESLQALIPLTPEDYAKLTDGQ